MFDLSMEDAQEMERYGNSRWRMMEKSFKKALAAGVMLPFGSGAGPFPHGTQGDQFAYLVKWGMTPVQALRSGDQRGGRPDWLERRRRQRSKKGSSPIWSRSAAIRWPTSPRCRGSCS